MTLKNLLSITALALFSTAALAQTAEVTTEQTTTGVVPAMPLVAQPIGGTDLFKVLDADSNEMISEEEAAAHEPVLAQFKDLDINQDGQLSADEFSLLAKG